MCEKSGFSHVLPLEERPSPSPLCAPEIVQSSGGMNHNNSSQMPTDTCIHQHNCSTWNNLDWASRQKLRVASLIQLFHAAKLIHVEQF